MIRYRVSINQPTDAARQLCQDVDEAEAVRKEELQLKLGVIKMDRQPQTHILFVLVIKN